MEPTGKETRIIDAQCNRLRDHDWWHISCTDPKEIKKINLQPALVVNKLFFELIREFYRRYLSEVSNTKPEEPENSA